MVNVNLDNLRRQFPEEIIRIFQEVFSDKQSEIEEVIINALEIANQAKTISGNAKKQVDDAIANAAETIKGMTGIDLGGGDSHIAEVMLRAGYLNILTGFNKNTSGILSKVFGITLPSGLDTFTAVANSSTAWNAVMNSSTAWNAVMNSSTAMTAVANSSTAMTAVANSSTAWNAVMNSSTAWNAVMNSSTAMTAVANSSTAIGAIAKKKNMTARDLNILQNFSNRMYSTLKSSGKASRTFEYWDRGRKNSNFEWDNSMQFSDKGVGSIIFPVWYYDDGDSGELQFYSLKTNSYIGTKKSSYSGNSDVDIARFSDKNMGVGFGQVILQNPGGSNRGGAIEVFYF